MDVSTPHGDPRRLMTLLWRSKIERAARPGPRARISVDDIVNAAIAWADQRGVESITMRDLAAEVGVKPMTLYSHIPDKATLLALMFDAAMGTHTIDVADDAGWRDRVRTVIDANLRLFLAHPWLLEMWSERPPFGPGVIGKYERELAVLVPLGLPDVQVDAVLTWLIAFVRGAASDLIAHRAEATSGEEWWAEVGPLLQEVITPEEFPLASRIGVAAGEEIGGAYDAEASWQFGLERVLDGLAPLMKDRGEDPGDASIGADVRPRT